MAWGLNERHTTPQTKSAASNLENHNGHAQNENSG